MGKSLNLGKAVTLKTREETSFKGKFEWEGEEMVFMILVRMNATDPWLHIAYLLIIIIIIMYIFCARSLLKEHIAHYNC